MAFIDDNFQDQPHEHGVHFCVGCVQSHLSSLLFMSKSAWLAANVINMVYLFLLEVSVKAVVFILSIHVKKKREC